MTPLKVFLIEQGIRDFRATGTVLVLPYYLGVKAEALYLADRDPEALEAIEEAEKVVERSEERQWCAELRRLRGIFFASIGADETQIEASFLDAIRIAKEQKSISLEARAERTYAEYCRQKRRDGTDGDYDCLFFNSCGSRAFRSTVHLRNSHFASYLVELSRHNSFCNFLNL